MDEREIREQIEGLLSSYETLISECEGTFGVYLYPHHPGSENWDAPSLCRRHRAEDLPQLRQVFADLLARLEEARREKQYEHAQGLAHKLRAVDAEEKNVALQAQVAQMRGAIEQTLPVITRLNEYAVKEKGADEKPYADLEAQLHAALSSTPAPQWEAEMAEVCRQAVDESERHNSEVACGCVLCEAVANWRAALGTEG